LSAAKKAMPIYKMLWLLNLDYYLPYWMIFINTNKLINKLQKHNIDGINVWAGKTINPHFVKKFTHQNFSIYTWTINKANQAKTLFNYGVMAVTTDRAAWLSNELNQLQK
jgi:glycerophosphoryl diester phosphodiesterase